jgi:hypothetical protein
MKVASKKLLLYIPLIYIGYLFKEQTVNFFIIVKKIDTSGDFNH